MLLETLDASRLGNVVTRKGVMRAVKEFMGAGKRYNNMNNMIHIKAKFNGVFSKDNLPKIKDGAYVLNLDDKQIKGRHWFHYLLTEI